MKRAIYTDENSNENPNPFNKEKGFEKNILNTQDEVFIRKSFDENPKNGIALLYKHYYRSLCSHAVKFVGSKEIAEDLVSDVFIHFYTNLLYLGITSSFRFYLFRSVRNMSFNYLKSELRREGIKANELLSISSGTIERPDQVSQYEELYQDFQDAINKLPYERRKVYLLRKFEGKKYQEIANELGISVKTVDVQLTRANKFIRDLMKDKWISLLFIIPFV
jgi:RNA polymerase sigma-70 factor (ECF subfamily)